MLLFQFLHPVDLVLIGRRILTHNREDQPFFLCKMLLQVCLQHHVKVMQLAQQFSVMRIVHHQNLVQVRFHFVHHLPLSDVMGLFQIIQHLVDREFSETVNAFRSICISVNGLLCQII